MVEAPKTLLLAVAVGVGDATFKIGLSGLGE